MLFRSQALASADLVPGHQFDSDGIAFLWPTAVTATADNEQTGGQVLPIIPVPNATTLGLLGSASNGPSSGTATITYTDQSTQTFTLGFSDWTLNAGASQPSFGNVIAATMTYQNGSAGRQTRNNYLFYANIALQAGKTLQSVTLPASVTQGSLHVFAIGTRSTPNNLGFSNDSQPGDGNMDNSHSSYSVQALEASGITPGKPFSYDGVSFTIPASYGSLADNDLVSGQMVPITPISNATTLIVLGAADYNNESGTAIITYTEIGRASWRERW